MPDRDHIENGLPAPAQKLEFGTPHPEAEPKTIYWHGQKPYVEADIKEPFPWDEVTHISWTEMVPMDTPEIKAAVEDLNRFIEAEFAHTVRWGNGPNTETMRNVTPKPKLLTDGKEPI